MTDSRICSSCGEALKPAEIQCPRCGTRSPAPDPPLDATELFSGTDFDPDDRTEIYVETGTSSDPVYDGWTEVRRQLEDATKGEFEILKELGAGGMARVYMARDLALGRNVAIKVMAPGLLMGPGMIDRFRQEAVTIANLQHPNIVTIHTVRQAGNLHFFVMQMVEGGSLEDVLQRPEPIPIFLIQVILYQLGVGLSFAHRRGVVHRDIKPANVLMDKEGNAILTDFGIAKVTTATNLTQTGATMGTPAYMSPEQCRAGELSGASDQYSLGIVAFEMLTGRPPFQGSPFEVMQAHTSKPPPSIGEMRPDCPPELDAAVQRMLAKDPAHRFPGVADAIEAIGGYLPGPRDPIRADLARLLRPLPSRAGSSSDEGSSGAEPVHAGPTGRQGQGSVAGSPGRTTDDRDRPHPIEPVGPGGTGPLREAGGRPKSRVARWGLGAAGAVLLLAAIGTGLASFLGPSDGDSTPATTPATSAPPAVAGIRFSDARAEVLVGGSVQLRATILDSAGQPLSAQPVTWSSSDSTIAVAEGSTEEAVVRGVSAGIAMLLARSGGVEASLQVAVTAPAVGELTVTAPAREVLLGGSLTLRAILTDQTGAPVPDAAISWQSSDPEVLEVDRESGVATGRSLGRARVTAEAGDQSGGVGLAVVGRVESISIRPPAGSLQTGRSTVIRAAVEALPEGFRGPAGIQWTSSAPSVASAAQAAGDSVVISLLQAGEAVITARIGTVRGSTTLQVTEAPAPVTLQLSRASLSFQAVEGTTPPESQTVTVTVDGAGRLSLGPPSYRPEPGGWLLAAQGEATGQEIPLSLQVDTRGLAAGVYDATLPVQAGAQTRDLAVRLTLTANPATAPVQPTEASAQEIVALLTAYANAINAKNVNRVREVFPSLPQDAIDDLLRLPDSDTYYLQLAPGSLRLGSRERTLDGDVMSGVLGRDNRGELVRWVYTFGRGQRGWYIVSLRPGG